MFYPILVYIEHILMNYQVGPTILSNNLYMHKMLSLAEIYNYMYFFGIFLNVATR